MRTKILLGVLVILSCVLVLALGKVYYTGKHGRSVKSNESASLTDPKKDNEARGFSNQVYLDGHKVPYVNLEPSEYVIPQGFRPRICQDLDYRRFDCDPVFSDDISGMRAFGSKVGLMNPSEFGNDRAAILGNPKVCILKGEYDKAIENAAQLILLNDPPNFSKENVKQGNLFKEKYITSAFRYRSGLELLALALELEGSQQGALDVYAVLYHRESVEFKWAMARIEYARFRNSPTYPDTQGFEREFSTLLYLLFESVTLCSVDDVLNAVTDFEEKIVSPSYFPCAHPDKYEQVHQLYLFRDRCARIVNPRLHYMCGDDTIKLMLLTRKSYGVFVYEVEQFFRQDKRNGSKKNADSLLKYLKRVQELPY